MPDIDTELASVLRTAKAKPMNFAFVAKGVADGKLLAAKMPIPAKQVNQAKADLGGGVIWRGRCFGEDGQLVFEVAKEPPGTLANVIKKVIARDAGLKLPVEVRVNQALEEETAAPPAPPPPPAADGKAAVLKRLSALVGPYQAAVAAKGPDAARLQTLFGAVKGLLGSQDFAQAGKVLDELEPLVARARSAPPGAPPAGEDAARFAARLKALLPQIQQAQAGSGTAGQEIKLRVSEAGTFARQKDFAQANALLDQVEALLKQAPGAGGADPAAEWKKNLAAWTPAIKAALAAKGPNAPAVAKLLAQANALSKPGGDMAQALAKLTECYALAGAPPSQATEEEFRQRWAKAKQAWREASDEVDAQVAALQRVLLGTNDKELQAIANFGLNAVTGNFKVPLMAAMRDIDIAAGEALPKAAKKAGGIATNFRKHLGQDKRVAACDTNPFGVQMSLRQTLGAALDELIKACGA